MFYFPGTAALFLHEHTWLSDIAIESALTNYGRSGTVWFIKSRKPGNHHYRMAPVRGGWLVRVSPMKGA